MEADTTIDARDADHDDVAFKAATRAMWALGDYHRFATGTIWEMGPLLVDACGVEPGQRVLDVAAGSGNVALRAAEAGAHVVAADLTPENFEAGRAEAARRRVTIDWREADAESLPFDDGEFDVVASSFGAIFAPHHRAVADEMIRVCRPGGTIGMVAFRPEGTAAAFFELVAEYAPPLPPAAQPPLLWGREDHVRQLFGDGVTSLDMTRRSYVERSPTGPEGYRRLFYETFGPVIGLRAALAEQPDRLAAFDRDFLAFANRTNEGSTTGEAEYHYPYLLIVARRR